MKSGLRSDPSQWTDERQKRGLAGEEQAIRYLLSRGWALVAHRFRVGRSEIDLIVRRGDLVAFVEVKTRRGEAFGSPFAAVTGPKRRELVKVARAWGFDPKRFLIWHKSAFSLGSFPRPQHEIALGPGRRVGPLRQFSRGEFVLNNGQQA